MWTPRWWLRGILVGLIVGITPGSAAFARGPATVSFPGKLTLQDGKLTARIVAAPLRQVMEEVSRLSGARVLWLNEVEREDSVSAEFTDLSLLEGLKRILTTKNFMLFYTSNATGAQLTQIWISPQGKGQPGFTLPPVPVAKATPEDEEAKADRRDELASVPLDKLMQIAVQDQDPSVRERAVMYLGVHARTDPRAIGTLTHLAQDDTNPQVRAAAAEILQNME